MESTAMATASAGLAEAMKNRQLEAFRRILTQRTPEKEIRTRTGRGGKAMKYTDGAYVIRTLNEAFGWDWDFVADCEELLTKNGQPFEIKCRGMLTVRMGGRTITKTQYGCQPIEGGEKAPSIGDCYKGAATDALKKCASMLGIALDLYDSDYKPEKYADEPEPARNVKLEGAQPQPTKPADVLLDLNRTLGYTEAQLLKWLIGKFTLDGAQSLSLALNALTYEELSQAIDIFREKVERG
jgi:Rad52/22 family double-strand break repair protein